MIGHGFPSSLVPAQRVIISSCLSTGMSMSWVCLLGFRARTEQCRFSRPLLALHPSHPNISDVQPCTDSGPHRPDESHERTGSREGTDSDRKATLICARLGSGTSCGALVQVLRCFNVGGSLENLVSEVVQSVLTGREYALAHTRAPTSVIKPCVSSAKVSLLATASLP